MLAALPPAAAPVEVYQEWYGPAVATFEAQFPGNPHDPAENDVRVEFLGEEGERFERIAYAEGDSVYKAILVAPAPGRYLPVLVRNGVIQAAQAKEGLVELGEKLPRGFIRVDPRSANRFRWDSGEPYYPIGYNLGWQAAGAPPMVEQIRTMGEIGLSWTRIWANHWDSKNPWWPGSEAPPAGGRLWEPALTRWRTMVEACQEAGVAFQMVLFHHGAFSTQVDANWGEHPWNAANGGFLRDPADFFTDSEARRRAKMWLRQAVARHAHAPALMAWELFNEVEWTDAAGRGRWEDIAAWHREMAGYLRALDPYGHLITTSSRLDEPGLWEDMDYVQPHVYAVDVGGAIEDLQVPAGKPAFFGEFGPMPLDRPDLREALRDGLYAGMLKNHAGAPMFWPWDAIAAKDLHGELRTAALVIARSDLGSHPAALPRRVRAGLWVTARALGEPGWMTARLTGSGAKGVRVRDTGLEDGRYALTTVDLATGAATTGEARVEKESFAVTLPSGDAVVILKRQP